NRQAREPRATGVAREGQGDGAPIRGAAAGSLRSHRRRGGAMIPFELAEPASLAEAIKLLDPDDASVRPIAGGTALMLMMKAGVFRPTRLVSLRKLSGQMSRIAK